MTLTRRLISGTFQLTLSSGVLRLFSIFSMPILTRLLSPQAYGVVALLGTAISLVSVFALAGIDVGYARAYHSSQPPSGVAVENYCWRFAITAGLLVATFSALFWWFFSRHSAEMDGRLALLLAVGVVLSVVHTLAQTRARLAGRYRAMAMSIIVAGIIGVAVSVAIAVWWRRDATALLIPLLLGYLIPIVVLGAPSIAGLAKPSRLGRGEGAALVKIGLAGLVTAPMYWLLSSSDRWFLQHYHGADAVGVYSIGYSVAIVGTMLNTAVMSVWLPEASREFEQDKERAKVTLGRLMSRLMAAMALMWLIAAAAGGDIVRWLADARFHSSAQFVPFIAGGVFFYGISQLAVYGLVLIKQFKWAALWWLVAGLVCTLLNFALVPRYGGLGAAITQSVSFAFIFLSIFATCQAKYPVHLGWNRLAIAMAIILVAGLVSAPPWSATAPFSLLMKLPFGTSVTIVVSWIVAPDWFVRVTENLRLRHLFQGAGIGSAS